MRAGLVIHVALTAIFVCITAFVALITWNVHAHVAVLLVVLAIGASWLAIIRQGRNAWRYARTMRTARPSSRIAHGRLPQPTERWRFRGVQFPSHEQMSKAIDYLNQQDGELTYWVIEGANVVAVVNESFLQLTNELVGVDVTYTEMRSATLVELGRVGVP